MARPRKKKFTIPMAVKAAESSQGLITNLAKNLKCSYTVAKSLANEPEVLKVLNEEREKSIDFLESVAFDWVKTRDKVSVNLLIKMLTTLGSSRGYKESKQTVEIKTPQLNITFDK